MQWSRKWCEYSNSSPKCSCQRLFQQFSIPQWNAERKIALWTSNVHIVEMEQFWWHVSSTYLWSKVDSMAISFILEKYFGIYLWITCKLIWKSNLSPTLLCWQHFYRSSFPKAARATMGAMYEWNSNSSSLDQLAKFNPLTLQFRIQWTGPFQNGYGCDAWGITDEIPIARFTRIHQVLIELNSMRYAAYEGFLLLNRHRRHIPNNFEGIVIHRW